ncbi:MAG: tetraacyldisaccharide 4'-kinase [Bacteroidota bacterium]
MRLLRLLSAPIAAIYWAITSARNLLFDLGFLKTYDIPGKSICVGNLNVGGSGKSPLTRYLITRLQPDFKVQVLSRGYGRKTKGHIVVQSQHTSEIVGDEALQYFLDEVDEVHVCERRKDAIVTMDRSEHHVLLLDDALQHRHVRAGLTILVSDFNQPFFKDYLMPMGDLRESRSGAKRADIIVFTKCPEALSFEAKQSYLNAMLRLKVPVFFSSVHYLPLRLVGSKTIENPEHVLLITGIANPNPLEKHLSNDYSVTHLSFGDHFNYSLRDLKEIHRKFTTFDIEKTIIITTEKDFMRMQETSLKVEMSQYPWYVQPIGISLDREEAFLQTIEAYVRKN